MQTLTPRPTVSPSDPTYLPDTYVDGAVNQKGGAGKSTSAVGVAEAIVESALPAKSLPTKSTPDYAKVIAELIQQAGDKARYVRLHDMDPQDGSITFWLRPLWDDVPESERWDMSHVLYGQCGIDDATWPTVMPGVYIVPSDASSLAAWKDARPAGSDMRLRKALARTDKRFFAELIDCPPDLGALTIAALTAMKDSFVPLRPAGLDMKGVGQLNGIIQVVQENLNPDLDVAAAIVCGYLESTFANKTVANLRAVYPDAVVARVAHTIRVGEAQAVQQPIGMYWPGCTAHRDYRRLVASLYDGAPYDISQVREEEEEPADVAS